MASRLAEVFVSFLFVVAVVSAGGKQNLCYEVEENEGGLMIKNPGGGSIYYRWGSSKCGANSKLVYNGFVGGGLYAKSGSAVNPICLPKDPVLKPYPKTFKYPGKAYVYGAEYEMTGNWDHEVPCAVCYAKGNSIMMIPAKLTCPPKWKTEYTGYLAAGDHNHASGSEYVCIDESLESSGGGNRNWDGKLFYHVTVSCGSLPCAIYTSGKILPCVVCSI